ncbi:MAG: hypothetical protein HY231_13200 [Acidobacteria bacterium]|nr:hypothetical protein [Acidobacteriota bacterium]
MKILTLQQAERASDLDVKLVTVRASRYRVFGSPERIPDGEMAVVDLRGDHAPDDFKEKYRVLDKHPMFAIMLVQKLGE